MEAVEKISGAQDDIIVIEDLYKSFGETDVLIGFSLTVKRAENVVVLGKSGTGKSVLIKCLVGLIEPDSGEIKLFGQSISGLRNEELDKVRLKTGFLFQSAALYDSMSVRENLKFPLRRSELDETEKDKKVQDILENVGLTEAIDKMPSELSGGMKKRAGLARTLILEPEIMLYDEPTTGLDPITSKEISELILEMQKKLKITSIIITHDMACAKRTADRIIILKDGKVFVEGTYEKLERSEDEFVMSFFV